MALNDQQTEDIQGIQDQEKQFDPQGLGDPKKSPVTAKVVPIGTGPQGLSPDAITRLTKGVTEGTSGPRVDVPHDLSFQPKAGQDNYLLRAQDQGFLSQLAKTAGNLIPNVAADIIDMGGQMANIADTIKGSSNYDSGGMGELATAIRDPFGEVYREHPDKTFDLGDPAWWLQNIAGFVEGAASFVVPGEGEAAAFSKLGKLAAEAGNLGKIGLEATQALGHTVSAFSMGYLMSASAGKKVYDEAYKTNYDRFIRQGYDPSHAHEEASHMAAEGAAKTVQIGTLLNGALNLTALAPLFKGTPQDAMQGFFKSGEGAIQGEESLAGWKSRLEGMSPDEAAARYRHGLTSHGFQAFQVGLQGLNTEYAEKTGTAQGTGQQAKQLDMITDYFDKVTDQEGALNMLSGLLGGLTQNILMDRVPLHRIVRIDPTTNKPIYKGDDANGKYETQLVSARTRDMMGNRQYFASMRNAVLQDVNRMQDLTSKYTAAKNPLDKERYRQELMSVGDLNAVTMGMTDNWREVYKKLGESNPALKPDTTKAIGQLEGLQKIYDKVANRMATHAGEPDADKLQDHMFHQEASHYLYGKSIEEAERQVAQDDPETTNLGESKVHRAVATHLSDDANALDKAIEKGDNVRLAEIAKRYGVNAYEPAGLKERGKALAERLRSRATKVREMSETSLDVAADNEERGGIDPDILAQRIAIVRARNEHDEQKANLQHLRSSEGRWEFLDALRKNNSKWKDSLDAKAAADTENLFKKQQDKEMAAKLDKEQLVTQHNNVVDQQRGNVDKMGALSSRLDENRAKLQRLSKKKGFFRNIGDLPTKHKLRSQIAGDQAELARLEAENNTHNGTLQNLQGGIQDAAVKEDTARNAHREDIENDSHTQQDVVAPAKTEDTPNEGIASAEPYTPDENGEWAAEDAYAELKDKLNRGMKSVLDNLENVMPDEFSRDLAYSALMPYVDNFHIDKEGVEAIVEKMKDWWEEKAAQQPIEPVPTPSTSPVPGDAIEQQSTQISDMPEADSPIISFNAALNIDNIETAPIFKEVGAKALTSMKVNSRSIQYMRVEKGDKVMFLPLYDKLDPTFNKNSLKPGFVSDGDVLRFEVDTNWAGLVTLDNADEPNEFGMPTKRTDYFSDYTTPDGKIIMTRQADDLEPPYGNAPIKIIHDKSGETIGYLPRVDWVTAKRPDAVNYRNIEDNIVDDNGEVHTGNVDAQKEKLMAVRAAVAQAHNRGEEPIKTHVSSTGPGHLFLATDVNVNTERSKLAPKLAKNLLPDKKLQLAILNKGTMMVGKGTPHTAPANFNEKTLADKYQTEGKQWNNTPMVLLPMPNGKVTESPLFTRKLADRPADIHTIAKAMESYLAQGTAAETDEHRGIINKLQQHTGYDISTANGLKSFINQYYTYTQPFNEVHTRANAETSGPKVPRFMVDIPNLQSGESKSAIKVGTSFSGTAPIYALTRDGKLNPEFDQALRDGLQIHYKNVVYTSGDIKGINDTRPITAVTIQRDGKVRTDRYDSYNDYAKSFTSTIVYGLHRASDTGPYLYGANPITEFDFHEVVSPRTQGAKGTTSAEDFDNDEFIRAMMNSAVAPDNAAVDYRLKVVEGLSKIPERMFTDFFQKGNKEKFYSELQQKHGVPKQQVEMLKAYNEKNEPASLGEMMAGIAADMSYTVEINEAQRPQLYDDGPDYTQDPETGQYVVTQANTITDAGPSDHYSYMTVPGGTNYRENEIRTPDITPSIRGHAAFSTDNGIGWFRSDDKRTDTGSGKMVSDRAGGLVQEGQVTDSKTRRILEVQSDLFQKGRNREDLAGTVTDEMGVLREDEVHALQEQLGEVPYSIRQNNFFQLLNKDNNWVTFFVKSIIQDSTRKGYENVLFPAGDTANKIEGQDTLDKYISDREAWIEKSKNTIKTLEGGLATFSYNGTSYYKSGNKYYEDDMLEDGTNEISKASYEKYAKLSSEGQIQHLNSQIIQFEKELADARAGTTKFSAINNFYENTIQNILNKQQFAPERIKDEHGNEWYKVDVGGVKRELAKGLINLAMAPSLEDNTEPIAESKVYTREQLVATAKGAPLSEEAIQTNINKLYDDAAANPEQGYYLDVTGPGKTRIRLADGTYMNHFKLAQMLNSREIPYNIRLSDDLRSALENTPKRFLNSMMFQDDSMYAPLKIDDKVLGEQLDNTFVPVRDEAGVHTGGYFSPERQTAVVDSVVRAISIQLDRNPRASVGDMMTLVRNNAFGNLRKIYERLAAGETVKGFDVPADQAQQMAKEYGMVLNSFEPKADALSFWGEAMKKLDQLGMHVRENKRPQREDEVPAITNGNDETMEGSDGKGRDWFDDHFEQNPMDSASSRVKMFIATTTDSTLGTEPTPPRVKLSIDNEGVRQRIAQGKYLFTAITVEEAKKLGLNGVGTEGFNTIDGKPFRITNVGVIQEGDVHAPKIAYEENKEVNKGDIKLQFTPWKPKSEQLLPNRNYLGLPKLADYEKLYEDAMATLGDTPRSLDGYTARLKEEGRNGRPNLYALATNLEKALPQIQNEFVSVMTLHYQPFTMILADPKVDARGKPYNALRVINANRASQLNLIVDHWQQAQKTAPILEKTSTGTTIVAAKLARQLKAELHEVNKLFEKGDGTAPTKAADLLRRTLESNGIILPEKAMESLIAKTKRWTQKTSVAGDFRKQFAVTSDGKAQGLVSAIIMRLAGEGGQEEMLDSMEDKSYQLNNPLYMEGTAMKVLSMVTAAYTPNLYSNTHRSSEGKNIYDWGLPHNLSNAFNKLKINEQWRQQFQASDFAKRSWLLEHISNNPEMRDRAGLSYLDGIRAARGKSDSGTTRPQMSDREQLFTAVGLFQNGNDSRYAHYLSLTHSDRSTSPVYLNMPRIPVVTTMRMEYDKVNDMQRPRFGIHDEVVKRMYDVFLSEYDRINKSAQVIEKDGGYNDIRYEKGSQYFYTLPQFNHDNMENMVKAGKITEADFNSVWMMGEKKLNVLEGRGFKEAVDKVLRQHVEELMGNTVREWKEKGLVSDDNVTFDRKYINKLLSHVGILSNKDGSYRTRDNQAVPEAYVNRLSAQLAARDFAVNSFLFNTSLSQVFFGDPAQNFKGSVEKTMVEYGKRLTQFISPRKEGNWSVPEYTAVTVKDFITRVDYLGDLSKAYSDINATDAQEVTTVAEKLNVARAYGRISEDVYRDMLAIVKDAKGGYYEFTKPDHLAFIMQPEKPLYSGARVPFQGAILNDYVKSSAYPLYPPLVAGKELDKLRVAMEKGGVDRVNFESAKKVGIPAAGLQLFDSQGRINEGVFNKGAWTGMEKGSPVPSARQQLSRDNFGLSQEVPYDETKTGIRIVSQMNKLITEAIPTITTPFDYKEGKISGAELTHAKEEIRKQLVKINQDKLLKESGAAIDDDGNVVIRDRQKVYDALLKHAQDQGGYSPNDLAILQHTLPNTDELIIPLMFSPSASKFESLVMSLVNGVTDIYMPGKSYVQASSAGHRMVKALGELSPEERKAITRVGDWDGGELKMLRPGDNGESLPAQVLLPFNFMVDGKPVSVQRYTKVGEDGNTYLDMEQVPKELLQLVGARIPNSGHNLMLPTEIVGFVPAEMGDLAIVPDAITKQMGSDFDVDKLYTYRRGYVHDKKTNSFKVIPAESDDMEGKLKNDYFETHWSVLMNPEMRDKVLSPLDKEDLKDEAAQIEQWESRKDKRLMSFFDPMYQLQDFQSQKDAKQLVGQSSLSVTFNSVIQDKGLTIGFLTYDDEGNVTPVDQPIEIIDEDGKKRSLSHLSGYGRSEYRKDGEKTGQMRTKNDNHVMQQAEFLDYSKNRISDKVHLTVHTYPASAALTQLQEPDGEVPGWTPSIKYNTRLLSQPIVQEYSQLMAQSQDTFSEDFDPDRKNSIIGQLAQRYIEQGNLTPGDLEGLSEPVRFEDLTDALKKGEAQKDYYLNQVKTLQLFKQLDQVGAQMSTAQSTINQDVNGAGPNLLTTLGKDYTRTRLELPLFSEPDRLAILQASNLYTRMDGKSTEQGMLYDTMHKTAYGIAGDFFPYKEMKPMFDFIMEHTNRDDLSVDMQKNVFNAMKSYLFSHPKLGLWEDPVGTRAKLLYGDSLARRVLAAKTTWGRNDLFLQRLQPDIDPDGLRPDYVKYQAAKVTKIDQDENTRHWIDLLTNGDPVKQQLGHDLVRYAYLTGGIQDSTSFIKFMPYSYLIGTDFGHKLRELSGNINELVMADSFKTQVFQHNPQIAKSLSVDFRETGSTYEKYPERFSLPVIDAESGGRSGPAKDLVVRAMDTDGKRRPMYPDFLSHYSKDDGQWILYKKAALLSNGSSELGTSYVRIDTLGDSSMDEYSFSEGMAQRSLIPANRSFAYNNIDPAFRMLNSALSHKHGREVVEDLKIPGQGGHEELSGVLGRLAVDKTVPEHARVLSSWLATLSEQGKSAAEALAHVSTAAVPPLTFELLRDPKELSRLTGTTHAVAAMDSFSNKLYISEQHIADKGEMAKYLNHELLHYHTSSILMLGEDRPYMTKRYNDSLDTIRYAERLYSDIVEKNPEVKKAIDDLHDIRMKAQAAVKQDLLQRGRSFEQEYERVIKNSQVRDDWQKWIYATASNSEFLAHVLTDTAFMQYLNSKQDNKGILGRVAGIVKRIMSAVAHALGTDVQKGSLLESAIDKSMAMMLQGRAEAIPDREEMATPNNMESQLNWTNAAVVNPTLTAMDRLAGKLQEQHDELVNSLTGRLSKKEYSEKRTQLDQIEQDIQALRQHQSFQVAAEIGNRHLDWVADILKQEEPTPAQIMTANRVLEVWGNLIPLVYGEGDGVEEPDPAFAQLAAKAQDMDFKMLRKAEKALVQLSDGTISMRDYSPTQLRDISKDQSLLRDVVSAAGAKVTQYIGTHMQVTARHAMDDITRLVKETRAVEDALKGTVGDLNNFYDKFFQQNKTGDAWGLVQRFSQNWYDFRRSERSRRQNALKKIDIGGGDLAQKAQMKAQVWDHYWKTIDKHAIFADTRKLFDRDTGDLKDDDIARAHIAELEKATDKATAKELVDGAKERYRQYLDHKEPYFDQLDAELSAGTKTVEEVKRAKDDFVNKWSPNAFFANRSGKFGTYGGSDYYARMAPRSTTREFYDEKFHAIHNDPTSLKFYQWLTGKMEDLKSALPVKVNDEYLGANFFPVVRKSLVTDLLDIPEYIRTMGERTMRDLGATPWEETMNASTFRQLPIDYIDRDIDKTPLDTRSKDIPRVLEVFGMMALHYKHFSDAKDSIDMGEAILQKLDQARAAGTTQMEVNGKLVSVNDGLKNTLDAVRYMKDYLMYRKARQLEGKSDMKLYSLNPVRQIKSSNRVKELLAEREKIYDQIMNGEVDPEVGAGLLKPIDAELKTYEGLRIYGSKLGDKLITVNQLKTLSYNPFSGLANMTFGVVSAGIHANGGRDYSWKDLGAALKMMMHSTAKWVTLGSAESHMAEKILAVMDRTGVIGDVVDSRYGKIDLRDRKAPWRHAVNPYNWMRSGDYFMKGLTTMAMMLHDKVKVTENGVEKEVSMWEAMDQEGKWDARRFGERKDWYSQDVTEQKNWDKYRNKVVRVNMIIHGNQDKSSPKLANKYILGRLLGQFRMSWLPEGWYSRFQKEHFDIQLDREVKGRYRTISQLGFGGYAMVTLKQLYSLVGKVDPYTGTTRLDGKALTETDRENMRRNFAELAFVTGILGMVAMTRAAASDTDDEKTAARYRLLMNMLIRNKQDLEFYASPQVFDTVTRDIIPAANVLKDAGKAMIATGKLIFNDDYQFQQWMLAMTHAGIPIPQATLINKTQYMLSKDLDNSPY